MKRSIPLLALLLAAAPARAEKKVAPARVEIAVSTAALRAHVDFLTIGDPRAYLDPERLASVSSYVHARLSELGLQTSYQDFKADERPYRNVVGVLNAEEREVIVVGAHYDVCGHQPGADDNASGVAALIEVARALAPRAAEIPYQIQFVAYANEEPPYFRTEAMGSHVHAQSLVKSGAPVRLMIALEMVGFFSDEPGSQGYPSRALSWFRPKEGNFIAGVSKLGSGGVLRRMRRAFASASTVPMETMCAPTFVTGIDFSDHMNYWKAGMRALMVTDTAFYRNPNYHQRSDKADTLDYVRMGEVVKGVSAFLLAE